MDRIGIPVFFSSQSFSCQEVTMNTIKKLTLLSIVIVLSLSFGSLLNPACAQDPAEVTTRTGLLTIIWGDEIGERLLSTR